MLEKNLDNIYELSINTTKFSHKLINILNTTIYNKISITNKTNNIPIIEIINKIQKINPKLEIIPYYSLKYNQKSTLTQTTKELLKQLQEFKKLNIKEILLISGVPKPKYDSIEVLKTLKSLYESNTLPNIAIAYNPFLTELDFKDENARIIKKLKTGIINSVYLQIGIDVNIIKQAVLYLRELQPNLNIYLSLINPTPSRLSKLKYRPWKGVYLSQKYLESSKVAKEINLSIYKLASKMKLGIIQGE